MLGSCARLPFRGQTHVPLVTILVLLHAPCGGPVTHIQVISPLPHTVVVEDLGARPGPPCASRCARIADWQKTKNGHFRDQAGQAFSGRVMQSIRGI